MASSVWSLFPSSLLELMVPCGSGCGTTTLASSLEGDDVTRIGASAMEECAMEGVIKGMLLSLLLLLLFLLFGSSVTLLSKPFFSDKVDEEDEERRMVGECCCCIHVGKMEAWTTIRFSC